MDSPVYFAYHSEPGQSFKLKDMRELIQIFKARLIWGGPVRALLISVILEVLSELPLTATSEDVENYINKCDGKDND